MKKYRSLPILLMLSCYLGLHNGNLALWEQDAAQPYHVFPYSAAAFPAADQAALRQGIPFSTRDQLTQLLEDYLS